MNRTQAFKNILTTVLCLVMLIGLPFKSSAAIYNGNEVTLYDDWTVSGNSTSNSSLIMAYVTNANDITLTTDFSSSYKRFYLDWDKEKWYFAGWQTYFKGGIDVTAWFDDEVEGANPTESGNYMFINRNGNTNPYSPTEHYIYINHFPDYYGTYYLYAIFKPIITVNTSDGVSYSISATDKTNVSENKFGVKYKTDATVQYQIDNRYVATSASGSGTQLIDTSTDGQVKITGIERPTTINIHTRLKQQTVCFDANGGEGSMETQTFEYGVAQPISAHNFIRDSHIFTGWNTSPDGSGTAYTANQTLTFSPSVDGETVTLYAMWQPYLKGDVNLDKSVTAFDALQVLQQANGQTVLTTQTQSAAADVSADNEITAYDALLILQYANGAIIEW